MFKPVDNPSALKALRSDPAVEQEHSYQARWQQEEQALNAYEDVALHDLTPVPMAEEAWEALLSHEARCAHEGDYDLEGRIG